MDKPGLETHVAHKPALEVAYVQAMIARHVRGPTPEGELKSVSSRLYTEYMPVYILAIKPIYLLPGLDINDRPTVQNK